METVLLELLMSKRINYEELQNKILKLSINLFLTKWTLNLSEGITRVSVYVGRQVIERQLSDNSFKGWIWGDVCLKQRARINGTETRRKNVNKLVSNRNSIFVTTQKLVRPIKTKILWVLTEMSIQSFLDECTDSSNNFFSIEWNV